MKEFKEEDQSLSSNDKNADDQIFDTAADSDQLLKQLESEGQSIQTDETE